MGFLKRLFGTRPEINAATAKIDEQVYLLNYREHYTPILGDNATPPRLAELFLFRAWTAQFGYRIFSTNHASSEKLIGETLNSCKYLGLAFFREVHGFSIEETLGKDFLDLIEERWRDYDICVTAASDRAKLPTIEIISALTGRLGLADPTVTYQLSMEFIAQLDLVKRTARRIGILA